MTAPCTTTLAVDHPEKVMSCTGETHYIHKKVVTETASVDCHGCNKVKTVDMNPVEGMKCGKKTATLFEDVTTHVKVVCAKPTPTDHFEIIFTKIG
ncbi:MAG: hypothetical protein M1827_001894 [Pycnora praestabilis]|nr:MAG: hypothetical protein M1827_001894 [Pycnora praestabilis]